MAVVDWMVWLVEMLFMVVWWLIKLPFILLRDFLGFAWRKFRTLEFNFNWFGLLVCFTGFVVGCRVTYNVFMINAKSALEKDKDDLAFENAIWYAVALGLTSIGANVAPRNENHMNAHAALQAESAAQRDRIRKMRADSDAKQERLQNAEEELERSRKTNKQVMVDMTLLKDRHDEALTKLEKENAALKEELWRLSEERN